MILRSNALSGLAVAGLLSGSALAGTSDCCFSNPDFLPGCSDLTCEEDVCVLDSFCCTTAWDQLCADQAAICCPDLCGTAGTGACCFPDGTCIEDLTQEQCEGVGKLLGGGGTWFPGLTCAEACPSLGACCLPDGTCIDGLTEDECGTFFPYCASTTSDCCEADPDNLPGCNDPACEAAVCAVDSFCCITSWDALCADEANDFCATSGGTWFEGLTCKDDPCTLPPKGTLSAEAGDCQGDVDPKAPGVQVAVELWMRDLTVNASGFQAFVDFNPTMLTYNAALSSYTDSPFPLHIIPIGAAQTGPGQLTLDGSAAFGSDCCVPNGGVGCDDPDCESAVCAADSFCCDVEWDSVCAGDAAELCPDLCKNGTSEDSLLAVLIFDVKDECATTMVALGSSDPFASELSVDGVPIPTNLSGTGPFMLDATPPTLDCPVGVKVAADVEIKTFLPPVSNCCTPEGNGGIGCDDAECEDAVCADDAFCCDVEWDDICAGSAAELCPVLCSDTSAIVLDPCVGAVVEYEVIVDDNCNLAFFECVPPSGSFFEIGTTTVTCTAIDKCGNTTTCAFEVVVNPTNLIQVDVVLAGSLPADRCIRFVTDFCDIGVDQVVTFGAFDNGIETEATVVIEVPCGEYSFLCGKDEQHTKWDTTPLVAAGDRWIGTGPIVLLPGDDDNDGDVDINDVTWLIATFGTLHAPGGCPWDGTRDADFNNGGAVGSEDYSLLAAQFLTTSSCDCVEAPVASLDTRGAIAVAELSPFQQAADLDRNGVFDWRDVAEFEAFHGLEPALSRTLRELR